MSSIVHVLLALVPLAGSGDTRTALIWSSETDAAHAEEAAGKAASSLAAAGLVLPDGYPVVVDSRELVGLRAGFQIVLLGLCSADEASPVLLTLAALFAPPGTVRALLDTGTVSKAEGRRAAAVLCEWAHGYGAGREEVWGLLGQEGFAPPRELSGRGGCVGEAEGD